MALDIAKENQIDMMIGHVTIALAHVYYKSDDYIELAEKYVLDAEQIAIKNEDDHLLMQINLTKGIHNYKNNQFDDCIVDYEKALTISQEKKDSFYISSCYFQLGLANFKLQNNETAANYFEEALLIDWNTGERVKKLYIYLAMVYATINSAKQNYYLTKYDSISAVDNERRTEELLLKFEASEKERVIEQLQAKKVEDELIIQKSRFNTIVIASILILSLFIIVLLVYRYITRQKILKQRIELEKQKGEQVKIELGQKQMELALKIDSLKENVRIVADLKKQIKEISNDEAYINTIVNSLEQNYVTDKHWDNIIHHFSALYKDHILDLNNKSDSISRNDIKLSILMKLGYANSGMAEVLNISMEGVKKAKQRLKKKLSE